MKALEDWLTEKNYEIEKIPGGKVGRKRNYMVFYTHAKGNVIYIEARKYIKLPDRFVWHECQMIADVAAFLR